MISWWPGDQNTVDIINTMNGAFNGGVYHPGSYLPGLVSWAFNFDANTYLLAPPVGNNFLEGTVEMWFQVRDWNWDAAPNGMFLWSLSSCVPDLGCSWDVMNLGTHRGYTDTGDLMFGMFSYLDWDWHWARSAVVPQPDVWYHIAGTWGPAGIKIYLNGRLMGTNHYTGPWAVDAVCSEFGRSSWADSNMNGLIDEPSVYWRALTAGEIYGIYAAGATGKTRPYYWSGGQGNWSDPNMWSNGVPLPDAMVIIPAASAVDVDLPNAETGDLILREDSTLHVLPEAAMNLNGYAMNHGTMTLSGNVTSYTSGDAFTQSGRLIIEPGVAMRGFGGGGSDFVFVQTGGWTSVDGTLDFGDGYIQMRDGTLDINEGAAMRGFDIGGKDFAFVQTGGWVGIAGTAETWRPQVNGGELYVSPTGVLDPAFRPAATEGEGPRPGPENAEEGPAVLTVSAGYAHIMGLLLGGVVVEPEGQLDGRGTIQGDAMVQGSFNVGRVGNVTMSPTGKLLFKYWGPTANDEYEHIASSGRVSLTGELRILRERMYVPAVGQQFVILTAAEVVGEFDKITGPGIYDLTYEADRVVMTVVEPPCAAFVDADLDSDCYVKGEDVGWFVWCLSGPNVPLHVPDWCGHVDFDKDWDVDQDDFGAFQRCYNGNRQQLNPHCAE